MGRLRLGASLCLMLACGQTHLLAQPAARTARSATVQIVQDIRPRGVGPRVEPAERLLAQMVERVRCAPVLTRAVRALVEAGHADLFSGAPAPTLDDPASLRAAALWLTSLVEVERITDTTLIRIVVRARRETDSARLANAIAKAFQADQSESRGWGTLRAAALLQAEIARVEAELAKAEAALMTARQADRPAEVALLGRRQAMARQTLTQLQDKLQRVRMAQHQLPMPVYIVEFALEPRVKAGGRR